MAVEPLDLSIKCIITWCVVVLIFFFILLLHVYVVVYL